MRRETFETPGEVTLDIRVPTGRIDIAGAPSMATEIELDVRGSDDEAADLLEQARIELREVPRGHEVIVHVDDRSWGGLRFWRKVDVRLSVRAPEGANVRCATSSADVRGRGRLGSLEAEAASGDIEFEELEGDAAAKAASGDVKLASVVGAAAVNTASGDVELGRIGGETVIKTASGDVGLEDAGSHVVVATASGDQRIAAVTAGRVDLKSASGDIEVGIREGSNVWVDARAMSGELSSEVELGDAPPTDEGPDDAPLVELKATSMSGDIEVVRAPAK
ncbi:MAG TPA: DUF4097 family beta strand repeat-containing protein [Gaiellaceae bacterium]|nr:DUF4097 family beta strand repeat-containing protein [Gaiellaceae bacterium]